MSNHYSVLGVSKISSMDEIKKAYRKLAMRYHPDKNPDDKNAKDMFFKIQKAYELLSDERNRKKYDEELKEGGRKTTSRAEKVKRKSSTPSREFDMNDFSKNFGNFFGFDPDSGEKINSTKKGNARKINSNDIFENFFKIKK